MSSLTNLFDRDASGKFPDYPGEDEGGSAAIFKEKDPAEVEAELKAKVLHFRPTLESNTNLSKS